MFSNITVSLLAAVGSAAWIYAKMSRSTGGDNKTSLVVAGIAGLLIFLTLLIIMNALFK